jgi:hypothetical protein
LQTAKAWYFVTSGISPRDVGLTDESTMDFWPQRPAPRRVDPVEINGMRTGLLGRVASERGVQAPGALGRSTLD